MFNLYFILGTLMGFICRFVFVYIISILSKIQSFSNAPVTISSFIVVISYVAVLFTTVYFLHESLKTSQIIGITIMLVGLSLLGVNQ